MCCITYNKAHSSAQSGNSSQLCLPCLLCAVSVPVQQSAAAFDGQPGSQLLLVGVQHVHALYAALLALPWCEPGQPDVPLLSAPVPFLHAQLCPLRLVVSCLCMEQQQPACCFGCEGAWGCLSSRQLGPL
jgi:hypothetical protein